MGKKLRWFILIITLTVPVLFGQSKVGKIFSKEEAKDLYGPVLKSKTMKVESFKKAIAGMNEFMMFKVKDNDRLVIKGADNFIAYTDVLNLEKDEVYTKYSLEVVKELLQAGDGDTIIFEMREDVQSVTYGNYTMELGISCPPWCP